VATSDGGFPASNSLRARSTRRPVRYWCGAMPNSRENDRTRCAGCAESNAAESERDNDHDNRAAVRAVHRDQLDLVGLALHGPRNAVDKVLKGARMYR
jgi:hypothetical protein